MATRVAGQALAVEVSKHSAAHGATRAILTGSVRTRPVICQQTIISYIMVMLP